MELILKVVGSGWNHKELFLALVYVKSRDERKLLNDIKLISKLETRLNAEWTLVVKSKDRVYLEHLLKIF